MREVGMISYMFNFRILPIRPIKAFVMLCKLLLVCTTINLQNLNQHSRRYLQNNHQQQQNPSNYDENGSQIKTSLKQVEIIPTQIINKEQIEIIQWPQQQMLQYNMQDLSYLSEQFIRPPQIAEIKPNLNGSNSSKPILCSFYKQRSKGSYFSKRKQLVVTIYGFSMFVDALDSTVSKSIKEYGTWSPQYINLIGYLVRQGHNVINLGSQSGLQAIIMGKLIGPTGRLFIFQPYSFSFQLVKSNIQINNLINITTLFKIAASDQKGNSYIRVQLPNTGGSQVKQINNKQGPTKIEKFANDINKIIIGNMAGQEVEVDRVDNLIKSDIKFNFALIDVQKMQVKALKGMMKIIQRSPDLVIMTEWQYGVNPKRNPSQTLTLLKRLQSKGYQAYLYKSTPQDVKGCTLGTFYKFSQIQQLMNVREAVDIFLFPPSVRIPK